MMEIIVIFVFATLFGSLLLRKVNVQSTVQTANAASFVNQTADRLHLRKLVGRMRGGAADTVGELNISSFDEIPVSQQNVNNSRAHIAQMAYQVIGGTGAVIGQSAGIVLTFERNQLFLDPDEAWFVNNTTIVGSATPQSSWNIWYED